MAVLRVWDSFELDVNGTKTSGGSKSAPLEITVAGQKIDKEFSLATATTLDAWISSEAVTDFDFLWLKCDQAVRVELTIDRGNEVGDEVVGFLVAANTPFRLFYDDALANYTANFATGTADVIDRVRIRNVSGSTTAGRLVLVT